MLKMFRDGIYFVLEGFSFMARARIESKSPMVPEEVYDLLLDHYHRFNIRYSYQSAYLAEEGTYIHAFIIYQETIQ